jgi:hypothetical protein
MLFMVQKVFLLVFFPLLCWGQSNDLAELQRVRFASPDADKWVKIKKDPPDDASFISDANYTDAWVKNPVSMLPVAYISGSKAAITPWFILSPNAAASCMLPVGSAGAMQMYVRAIRNGIVIGQRMLVKDGDVYWTSQLPFYFDFAPNIVQAYPQNMPFVITWKATFNPDDTNSWKEVGVSENPLYVLRAPKIGDAEYYYTSVHLSCVGANGLGGGVDGEKDVVDGIFSGFQDLDVRKVGIGEMAMNYWGSGSSTSTSVRDFLDLRNGLCGAWARFFQDILELQGIISNRIEITYKSGQIMPTQFEIPLINAVNSFFGNDLPVNSSYHSPVIGLMLIKKWAVIENGFYMLQENQSDLTLDNLNIISHADLTGISAQGTNLITNINTNPKSAFGDHIIIEYGSKYYDPSYGKSFLSKDEWERESLDGLGAVLVYLDLEATSLIDFSRNIIWISEKSLDNIIQTDFHTDPN